MTRKLVRNLSDKESREWWNAIETAARNAPKLDVERKPFPKAPERKADQPPRAKASTKR